MRARARVVDALRLAFSISAVVLIVFGLYSMRETSRSRGWAETSGRVIQSSVNSFTNRGTTTYRPLVVYSYSVDGVRFTCTRIAFRSMASGNRSAAARVAADYPVGRTVTLFYDPQQPDQSVLERGINPWFPIVAGGLLSMLAVWMRILRGRIDRKQPGR